MKTVLTQMRLLFIGAVSLESIQVFYRGFQNKPADDKINKAVEDFANRMHAFSVTRPICLSMSIRDMPEVTLFNCNLQFSLQSIKLEESCLSRKRT